MRHPTDGVLRRLLDEPAGVADAERAHVAACPRCLDTLAELRADARLVEQSLSPSSSIRPPDTDLAWQRLSAAVQAGTSATPAPSGRTATSPPVRPVPDVGTRWRLRRPAVAAVAVAAVLAGAGTAAANDWLPFLQTERVAPVAFSAADLVSLPDLSAYGEVTVTGGAGPRQVADAATAEAETGLSMPLVAELPPGVGGDPTFLAIDETTATFRFDADRAAAAAAATRQPLPSAPPGLDGTEVRLVVGPGVAQAWQSNAGLPALVVGRAVAPTGSSSGLPFETVRDYVLSLPGIPADVAAQLRAFTADGSTLPFPVPGDFVTTSATDVGGEPATLLATRDGTGAAVVWVQDGIVTAVAGSLAADEVLAIARSLR